jgi:Cu-processing system permease protein
MTDAPEREPTEPSPGTDEQTAADGGTGLSTPGIAPPATDTATADVDTASVTTHDTETQTTAVGVAADVARVAVREYRMVVRRRWTVGIAVLFALFSAAVVFLGGSSVGPTRVPAVLASIAQLGVYLVPLAALAIGFDTVVGADESGSLEMLLALPLSNTAVVAGKYLGRAAGLGSGMLVGFAVGGALLVRFAGTGALGAYAGVALVAVAAALAFLSVSMLASTLASEKTHALGAALAAWVWFVLVHDLVALGLVASLDLPSWVVSAAVLANPADLFRVFVLRGVSTTAGGIAGVLTSTALTTPVLVAALLAWIVLPVAGAAVAFRRRSV